MVTSSGNVDTERQPKLPRNPRRRLQPTTRSLKIISRRKAASKKRRKRRLPFREMFQRLEAFRQEHGHVLVTEAHEDPELFQWTKSIRKNYRHQFTGTVRGPTKNTTSRLSLSPDKAELLNKLGFCWDFQNATWYQHWEQLQTYQALQGHCRVPKEYSTMAVATNLGVWVQNQRREYRRFQNNETSTLTTYPDRLEALESLGFQDSWQTQEDTWHERYLLLVEFQQKHGHVNVPQDYLVPKKHPQQQQFPSIKEAKGGNDRCHQEQPRQYIALGQWCMNQRTIRRNLIRQQQQALHQELDHLHELGLEQNISGNVAVAEHEMQNGISTGNLSTATPNTGSLTSERIQLLDALDFQWNVRDDRWNTMLERLKEYHERNGDITIPTTDTANADLRYWLIFQRHFYHRRRKNYASPMTPQRIEALETSIGNFSWTGWNPKEGPSAEDWEQLFSAMRDKGIAPGMRPKQHWFEGVNPLQAEVKNIWTDQDLMDLWNQEEDDECDEVQEMQSVSDNTS